MGKRPFPIPWNAGSNRFRTGRPAKSKAEIFQEKETGETSPFSPAFYFSNRVAGVFGIFQNPRLSPGAEGGRLLH